jgi:hypothetical protein
MEEAIEWLRGHSDFYAYEETGDGCLGVYLVKPAAGVPAGRLVFRFSMLSKDIKKATAGI